MEQHPWIDIVHCLNIRLWCIEIFNKRESFKTVLLML